MDTLFDETWVRVVLGFLAVSVYLGIGTGSGLWLANRIETSEKQAGTYSDDDATPGVVFICTAFAWPITLIATCVYYGLVFVEPSVLNKLADSKAKEE